MTRNGSQEEALPEEVIARGMLLGKDDAVRWPNCLLEAPNQPQGSIKVLTGLVFQPR
jgi:hypothetical protein